MSRKSGQSYPINDNWRAMIQRKLDARDVTRAELANRVGCSPSVITQLLNGDSDESPLVPRIHLVLDLSPPHMAVLDEPSQTMLEKFEKLNESDRARILERIDILSERAPSEPTEPAPRTPPKKR